MSVYGRVHLGMDCLAELAHTFVGQVHPRPVQKHRALLAQRANTNLIQGNRRATPALLANSHLPQGEHRAPLAQLAHSNLVQGKRRAYPALLANSHLLQSEHRAPLAQLANSNLVQGKRRAYPVLTSCGQLLQDNRLATMIARKGISGRSAMMFRASKITTAPVRLAVTKPAAITLATTHASTLSMGIATTAVPEPTTGFAALAPTALTVVQKIPNEKNV